MKLRVYREAGFEEAILGLSLSFYDHKEPIELWWNQERRARAIKRAYTLAHRDGGHNKFLESIQVWVLIQATRGFWQEFDTYRSGVTKQSASTMHTLTKRAVTIEDFEEGTSPLAVENLNLCLLDFKNPESNNFNNITILKENLPEGWLQERMVCTNYKTLRNIYSQRNKHRYIHWRTFCQYLLEEVDYPHFITTEDLSQWI